MPHFVGISFWFCLSSCLAVIAASFAPNVAIADTVAILRDGQKKNLNGEVLEFTGSELRIKLTTGREETIAAKQVLQVESEWLSEHRSGDQKFAAQQFAEAIEAYRAAQAAEKRVWVKRRILARTVAAHRHLNDWQRAGELFVALYRNDPRTQFLDSIPLAWVPLEPDPGLTKWARQFAEDSSSPAAVLIGASLLISLGDRTPAATVLGNLTQGKNSDPRIVQLAECQLWRTRLVSATLSDAERWLQQIERMPEEIRHGAWFITAQVLSRHEQHEEAALLFLRGPLSSPSDRVLASEALWAAGRELEASGAAADAATLYRELVHDYGFSSAASQAQQRLSNSNGKRPGLPRPASSTPNSKKPEP